MTGSYLRTALYDECPYYRPPSAPNKRRWSTNCDFQDTVMDIDIII